MKNLTRLSIRYIDTEDRVRLTGETAPEQIVVLWLTLRLCNRLIPHLCAWLVERVGVNPQAEVKQQFAQQKAQAELLPQAPVRPAAEETGVLIHSVDVKAAASSVLLVFKQADGDTLASLRMQPKPLRQWLSILHGQYRLAGWPNAIWPAWVEEARPLHPRKRANMVH
jgi:hypothetical protein